MHKYFNIIAFEYNKNGNNTFIEVFEKEIAKSKLINIILIIILIIETIIFITYIISNHNKIKKIYEVLKDSPLNNNNNKKEE